MPTPQSCVEALLIESGLSLPYAFHYKKPGFLPRTPLPNEPYNFFCEMAPYIEICYAYSGGAGGFPAQKFGRLVTAGDPTAASFADRLLAHTQQAFADTPKKQKSNNKRCSDLDYHQSRALS